MVFFGDLSGYFFANVRDRAKARNITLRYCAQLSACDWLQNN